MNTPCKVTMQIVLGTEKLNDDNINDDVIIIMSFVDADGSCLTGGEGCGQQGPGCCCRWISRRISSLSSDWTVSSRSHYM